MGGVPQYWLSDGEALQPNRSLARIRESRQNLLEAGSKDLLLVGTASTAGTIGTCAVCSARRLWEGKAAWNKLG